MLHLPQERHLMTIAHKYTCSLKPLQGLVKLVEGGDVTLFFDQIQVYIDPIVKLGSSWD